MKQSHLISDCISVTMWRTPHIVHCRQQCNIIAMFFSPNSFGAMALVKAISWKPLGSFAAGLCLCWLKIDEITASRAWEDRPRSRCRQGSDVDDGRCQSRPSHEPVTTVSDKTSFSMTQYTLTHTVNIVPDQVATMWRKNSPSFPEP